MRAPVTITATKPSASGSDAAASEPKTASRISATIGKPITSAFSRSSLESSCRPAHAAGWPIEVRGDAVRRPRRAAISSRRSVAASDELGGGQRAGDRHHRHAVGRELAAR